MISVHDKSNELQDILNVSSVSYRIGDQVKLGPKKFQ